MSFWEGADGSSIPGSTTWLEGARLRSALAKPGAASLVSQGIPRSPSALLSPFSGDGLPKKTTAKKGSLILSSLLEDLVPFLPLMAVCRVLTSACFGPWMNHSLEDHANQIPSGVFPEKQPTHAPVAALATAKAGKPGLTEADI